MLYVERELFIFYFYIFSFVIFICFYFITFQLSFIFISVLVKFYNFNLFISFSWQNSNFHLRFLSFSCNICILFYFSSFISILKMIFNSLVLVNTFLLQFRLKTTKQVWLQKKLSKTKACWSMPVWRRQRCCSNWMSLCRLCVTKTHTTETKTSCRSRLLECNPADEKCIRLKAWNRKASVCAEGWKWEENNILISINNYQQRELCSYTLKHNWHCGY